jgi:hypothetical protein
VAGCECCTLAEALLQARKLPADEKPRRSAMLAVMHNTLGGC